MGNLRDIDRAFDEQLSVLTAANADNVILNLGHPSAKVKSAGVQDKPLKLFGNKIIKKIRKHGFDVSELNGLTKSVRNPIAVFKNKDGDGRYSILTELKTKNRNFLVAIKPGVDSDADFNIVASVFGKDDDNIVDWISKGFLRYIDKKKALKYLHLSSLNAAATNKSRLDNATKVVKTFKNNNIRGASFVVG